MTKRITQFTDEYRDLVKELVVADAAFGGASNVDIGSAMKAALETISHLDKALAGALTQGAADERKTG